MLFRYGAFFISLLCLRYFVMSPSVFRIGAFVNSLWHLRYFVMSPSIFRYFEAKKKNDKLWVAKWLVSAFIFSLFRYGAFIISLWCLRYFVMSPSLFRYGAFLIRYFAFVMSPRNGEKREWHKSATIECSIAIHRIEVFTQHTLTHLGVVGACLVSFGVVVTRFIHLYIICVFHADIEFKLIGCLTSSFC